VPRGIAATNSTAFLRMAGSSILSKSKHAVSTLPSDAECPSSGSETDGEGCLLVAEGLETIVKAISKSHALKLSQAALSFDSSRITTLFTEAPGSSRLMDTLETIFSMQKELASMMDLGRYPISTEGKISALSTAIIHEAVELQRLTSWKWWKKPTAFDTIAAKEELIDIWHFVVQASIELGMSPAVVMDEYIKKNRVNQDRQTSGY
jgi:dimeric dUTPase (all-alpha-NTP-PPase superfamily)